MGARGSSLVGKAVVNEQLMPYTSYSKQNILEMRLRHLHGLGGRFALGKRQFSSLLQENEDGDKLHMLFDTDKNGLVDALEVIASLTMLSSMTIKDKIDIIHSLYDFNGTGKITVDEMTILLRTVAAGCWKMDPKGIMKPETRDMEELAKWAFRKAGLDTDAEIAKYDFDDFCLSNPTARTFLDYWSGASNQVVIARNELWVDPDFKPNGSSLYFNLTDAPDGMLPAATVRWLRPKMIFAMNAPRYSLMASPKLYSDGGLGNQVGDGFGSLVAGQMANHWLLNAMSLVASNPALLRNLFVWTGQEHHGRYCLRFFKEERWVNVVVDDLIPCNVMGKPLFATSTDPNELWPLLVEKAYAKLHKCYQNLVSGSVEYALRDMTGSTVERVRLRGVSDELWAKLRAWASDTPGAAKEHLVGCVWNKRTRESIKEGGTLQGIEFAVMHTVLTTVEFNQFRLVRVRNPWGKSYFNGDWSNGSNVWAKAPSGLVEKAVLASGGVGPGDQSGGGGTRSKKGGAQSGSGSGSGGYLGAQGTKDRTCFWMVFDDFVKLFDMLVVAHLHDSSAGKVGGGGGAGRGAKSLGGGVKSAGSELAGSSSSLSSGGGGGGGWTHQFRKVVFPATGGGSPPDDEWVNNPQFFIEVKEQCEVQVSLTQRDARYHGNRLGGHPQALGLLLHRHDWGQDHTCVKPLERLFERTHAGHPGLVARTEPFVKRRECNLGDSVVLDPGKYVLVPMTFRKAGEESLAAGPGAPASIARQCWLSVFSRSRLYPLKLYSDAEVEYDDPSRVPDPSCDIVDFTEDPSSAPRADEEEDNETVALAALSELVSDMWVLARQLMLRKEDLEEKLEFLEEAKRRQAEDAAAAAEAAALDD